jgi:hypothetical protein
MVVLHQSIYLIACQLFGITKHNTLELNMCIISIDRMHMVTYIGFDMIECWPKRVYVSLQLLVPQWASGYSYTLCLSAFDFSLLFLHISPVIMHVQRAHGSGINPTPSRTSRLGGYYHTSSIREEAEEKSV